MNHGGELFDNSDEELFNNPIESAKNGEDTIYDLLDVGRFNQENKAGKKDESNEETRSSWSSSEEALAACEGLIFNVPLNGGTKCRLVYYRKIEGFAIQATRRLNLRMACG